MKSITLEQVLAYNPCYEDEESTKGKTGRLFAGRASLTVQDIFNLDSNEVSDSDKIWILNRDHFLSYSDKVRFAVFCAEQCIHIWESEYPNNLRPRKAIEAAKLCINNPTDENKMAAAYASISAYAASRAHSAAYAADCASFAAGFASASAAFAAADAAAFAARSAGSAAFAADCAGFAAGFAPAPARESQLQYLKTLLLGDMP